MTATATRADARTDNPLGLGPGPAAARRGDAATSATPAAGAQPAALDFWQQLAARFELRQLKFRQDGQPRDGREGGKIARFVPYLDGVTVYRRLDAVTPGDWSFVLEPLRPMSDYGEVVDATARCAFRGRLTIRGVVREAVGQGRDLKAADTDAFKRAAARFGIGQELHDYPHLWVPVEVQGKYAKPKEHPGRVLARLLQDPRNQRAA